MRAFIVGNGPSLAKTNLDLIKGEISFAANRIHLIFPHTSWRPTHYVRAESPFESRKIAKQDLKEIFQLGIVSYLNRSYSNDWRDLMRFEAKTSVVEFLPDSCSHTLMHYDDPQSPLDWHEPICSFGSSLHVAIQLAVKLGYGPLYLLGCDLGYTEGQPSHFDPKYEVGYEEHLKPAFYANRDCLHAHQIAKQSSKVKIYNATIGGNLDVYERVDYEKLMRGDEWQKQAQPEITTPTEKATSNTNTSLSTPKKSRKPASKSKASSTPSTTKATSKSPATRPDSSAGTGTPYAHRPTTPRAVRR